VPSFPLILYVHLSFSACVSKPSFTPSYICTFVSFFSLSEPSFLLFLYPYLHLLFLYKHLPFSASVFVSSFLRLTVRFFPHSSISTYLTPPLSVPSFPQSSICTLLSQLLCAFLSPLLCMHLCFSTPVYLPFSTSLSIHFSLCSTFSPSQKIKEMYEYSFCTLMPTYQITRRHMPENSNIKVFVHIKEAMTYSQDYKHTILCNWNAVQGKEVGKEAPDRCPVSCFKGRRAFC